MNMPGFMAEASLTNSSGTYRAARCFLGKGGQANVTPAVGKLCMALESACYDDGWDPACKMFSRVCWDTDLQPTRVTR